MQLKKVVLSLFFVMGVSSTSICAQSTDKEATASTAKPIKKAVVKPVPVKKTTLDTEESFKFLGNQLLFQVKKRLNLTTEEEEKNNQDQAQTKNLAFLELKWREVNTDLQFTLLNKVKSKSTI